MKKTALLLAAVLLLATLAPLTVFAEGSICNVEYIAMSEHIRFDSNKSYKKINVAVGNKLPDPNASTKLRGGSEFAYHLQSTGEEIDITDYTVTEDVTIEVSFKESPEPIHCVTFYSPGEYLTYDSDTVKIYCADGYVLSEDDVPDILPAPGDFFTYTLAWTPDPIGYEVHEDITFTGKIADTGLYQVRFFGQYIYEPLKSYTDVPRGTAVEPPEAPEKDDYVFMSWTSDEYLNVQKNIVIFANYALRGDANLNNELDVGDATLILRAVVHLNEPGLNYDYNHNGRVDSGDAAGILIACVGK